MPKSKNPADWDQLLDEYQRRVSAARAMGGKEKLAKRKQSGRNNARQLIDLLVDAESFQEYGTLVGGLGSASGPPSPADALVGGVAMINGRHVVIAVEDFTVQGGSIGHGTNAKRIRLAKLAAQERIPYLLILDGAGARVTNSLERHPYAPTDLQELAKLTGTVPTIALVLGTSAGHGALTGLLMDFVIMLDNATLFSVGPPLVAAALGEIVTKEELGSAKMHCSVSGVAHNRVADEQAACELIHRYLDYFPQNAWEAPQRAKVAEDQHDRLDDILQLIPRNPQIPYDIHKVIEKIFDRDSTLEIQPEYGTAIVTCLANLDGHRVAVVANQPMVMAGSIDASAAAKATHFISLANAFHLPVVFLADNPGIMSGSKAEQEGTLRAAARMYAAQARLRTPKLHVTLRKAFGFGSSLMAMNPFDQQTISLALPGITLGGIPAAGGAKAAKLDEDMQAQLQEEETSGAWSAGDNMAYDEVIDPRDLRIALVKALSMSIGRAKHDLQPVLTQELAP